MAVDIDLVNSQCFEWEVIQDSSTTRFVGHELFFIFCFDFHCFLRFSVAPWYLGCRLCLFLCFDIGLSPRPSVIMEFVLARFSHIACAGRHCANFVCEPDPQQQHTIPNSYVCGH